MQHWLARGIDGCASAPPTWFRLASGHGLGTLPSRSSSCFTAGRASSIYAGDERAFCGIKEERGIRLHASSPPAGTVVLDGPSHGWEVAF